MSSWSSTPFVVEFRTEMQGSVGVQGTFFLRGLALVAKTLKLKSTP